MRSIHELATLTSKGQITLPKSIRQALGVMTGGKVAFELRGSEVIVTRAETDHEDPAIDAFLDLLEADIRMILEAVPSDPARDEYRQGNTLGPDYRHWRRAKIGRRFRVFFRYESKAKTIVFAWVGQ